MTNPGIRNAGSSDAEEIAAMMALLWPEGSVEEHRHEADELLRTSMCGTLPAAIIVAEGKDRSLVGFVQVGLRSHGDGCDVARAVGFIEGWFVAEPSRGSGIGRALVRAAEAWARANGCVEMASDALIDNEISHRAHEALGFEVIDRCVHYRKKL